MTGGGSSIPEVQRLLATLVASKPGGRIAEIGTAFGGRRKSMRPRSIPGWTPALRHTALRTAAATLALAAALPAIARPD